ncbi:DegT/DnrJ/EryC1/StrS family aminotransferase, partial [Salmonella enterica subsp. enterica serovar Kentucky]|nr:DegT/DnrJ/EryC1/StrS family aminotransferase [Salmonella enterica subsp. enterica serovar Kentucky]
VESVENIMRLDWQQVHTAEKAVNGRYITSIACLDDNKETNNLFVDIRPDTMNIDETLIEAAITDKTRAIVPVHYAGVACEMDV